MPDVEHLNPYAGDERKGRQVERMFDSIAPAYDRMNRLMTLGVDRYWRRRAVDMLRRGCRTAPRAILDIATGTADLAMLLARRLDPLEVVGVDLSEGMLELGRRKVARAGMQDTVTLQRADALALPFPDDTFDIVTAAYGVRNFEDLAAGYREMYRVMRPGGQLCIVELSAPTAPAIVPLYRCYTRHVIPRIGRLLSRDDAAYAYLPASVEAVPQGEEMARLIRSAGFGAVSVHPFTPAVCTIYHARKRDRQ